MDDHFFDNLSESAMKAASSEAEINLNKNENKLLFSKLKESKTIQVDLNIEKNLSELEDPILIQHIADSRKKLEEYTK